MKSSESTQYPPANEVSRVNDACESKSAMVKFIVEVEYHQTEKLDVKLMIKESLPLVQKTVPECSIGSPILILLKEGKDE